MAVMYKIYILSVTVYGMTGVEVTEIKVLRKVRVSEKDQMTSKWNKLHKEKLSFVPCLVGKLEKIGYNRFLY
jgi:hypothetical protein